MKKKTVILGVPCFAGAPWDLAKLINLRERPLRSMRLPEGPGNMEELADFVLKKARGLQDFILAGDSFGAVLSLAVAVRRPEGLRALVLSGGFAKNPINSWDTKILTALAPFFPGPFYHELTLRVHASKLESSFDGGGEIPWSSAMTRDFFIRETSHHAYVNRLQAVFKADYTESLSKINVPTLILTPAEDRLIGKNAAKIILEKIPKAQEIILARTGHMFRFSHPAAYSKAISDFLDRYGL